VSVHVETPQLIGRDTVTQHRQVAVHFGSDSWIETEVASDALSEGNDGLEMLKVGAHQHGAHPASYTRLHQSLESPHGAFKGPWCSCDRVVNTRSRTVHTHRDKHGAQRRNSLDRHVIQARPVREDA
jgi:hypothetical protein